MSKWIQIWYSWGDEESPVEVPENQDAYEYMLELVMDEVNITLHECPHYWCGAWLSPEEGKAEIYYGYDNEKCYYLITDEEEYNPES